MIGEQGPCPCSILSERQPVSSRQLLVGKKYMGPSDGSGLYTRQMEQSSLLTKS